MVHIHLLSVAYPEINKGGAKISKKPFNSKGLSSQKFEKINITLEIVRFRGIFTVKRRYEILAEMSVLLITLVTDLLQHSLE